MNIIATCSRHPWNKGKVVGQKTLLRLRDIKRCTTEVVVNIGGSLQLLDGCGDGLDNTSETASEAFKSTKTPDEKAKPKVTDGWGEDLTSSALGENPL